MSSFATITLLALVLSTPRTNAEVVQDFGSPPSFSDEYLEQMVAPIALYPDALLMNVFMAATYPIEIVEAGRWRDEYPNLEGDELDYALQDADWDPNVKTLCGFPDVLRMLSENLDWTQDLGDAVLAQQEDLLAAVQRMRRIAFDSGNLQTTREQVVVDRSPSVIVIEPSNPDFIYVPTYWPSYVYTGWSYPHWHYPSFFLPHPPGFGHLAFHAGVFWGHSLFGHPDWGHHSIGIDVDVHNHFVQKTSSKHITNIEINKFQGKGGKGGNARFEHNPQHRRGANYKNSSVAKKFGGASAGNRIPRDQARGRTPSRSNGSNRDSRGSTSRSGSGASRDGFGDRSSDRTPSQSKSAPKTTPGKSGAIGGTRDNTRDDRAGSSRDRSSTSSRDRSPPSSRDRSSPSSREGSAGSPKKGSSGSSSAGSRGSSRSGSGRSGAYSGARNPRLDRSAGERGASSRGSRSSGAGGRASTGGGAREDKSTGDRQNDRSSGGRSSGGRSSGGRPSGGRSSGGRPSDDRSGGSGGELPE